MAAPNPIPFFAKTLAWLHGGVFMVGSERGADPVRFFKVVLLGYILCLWFVVTFELIRLVGQKEPPKPG